MNAALSETIHDFPTVKSRKLLSLLMWPLQNFLLFSVWWHYNVPFLLSLWLCFHYFFGSSFCPQFKYWWTLGSSPSDCPSSAHHHLDVPQISRNAHVQSWHQCSLAYYLVQVCPSSSTPSQCHRQLLNCSHWKLWHHCFLEIFARYPWVRDIFFSSPMCAQLLSCVWFFVTPWMVAHQAPLSTRFSWQEDWSGLPCPTPGDHPVEPVTPASPVLQADSLLLNHRESPRLPCTKC